MTDSPTARGWREIKALLRVKDYRTAMKTLKRMGLLFYEGRVPVLSKDRYRIALYKQHDEGVATATFESAADGVEEIFGEEKKEPAPSEEEAGS